MGWNDIASLISLLLGSFFFLAGTVGLIRLPDVYTRLHALTKADNIGLGLIALAVAFQTDSWTTIIKLILIWGFVLISGATIAHLIARSARLQNQEIWEEKS